MIKLVAGSVQRLLMVLSLGVVLLLPQMTIAQAVEEDPSALSMSADLVIARPLLAVATVVGAVTYVVSLPFSLLGGNAKQAGQTLVADPFRATFVRCLGCKKVGYQSNEVYNDGEVAQ